MKINNNTKIITANMIVAVLLLLPAGRLDLFHENYSTLSLDPRGHLYLLAVSSIAAVLFYLETRHLGKREALGLAAATIISCLIPHHVPYDFQGDLHLFLAYAGSFTIVTLTLRALWLSNMKKAAELFVLLLGVVMVSYMIHMMVTLFSEIVLTLSVAFFDLTVYLRRP